MKIAFQDDVLKVSGIDQLAEANAAFFRNWVQNAWPGTNLRAVEIDLSQTKAIDSSGLGALIAVQRWAESHSREGAPPVRLLNPKPPIQDLLERTRLHRIFEIVKRGPAAPPP